VFWPYDEVLGRLRQGIGNGTVGGVLQSGLEILVLLGGEVVPGLQAGQTTKPFGKTEGEQQSVEVQDIGEGMVVAAFPQQHAALLVPIGTLYPHSPSIQQFGLICIQARSSQIPRLLVAFVPQAKQPYRHSVFLPIPGYWTPNASAFS